MSQKTSQSYEWVESGKVEGTIRDTVQIVEQAARQRIVPSLYPGVSILDAPVDYIKVYEARRATAPYVLLLTFCSQKNRTGKLTTRGPTPFSAAFQYSRLRRLIIFNQSSVSELYVSRDTIHPLSIPFFYTTPLQIPFILFGGLSGDRRDNGRLPLPQPNRAHLICPGKTLNGVHLYPRALLHSDPYLGCTYISNTG